MTMTSVKTRASKMRRLAAILLATAIALALLCVGALAESGTEYDLEPITNDIYLLTESGPFGVTDGISMDVSVPASVNAGDVAECFINCSLSGTTLSSFVSIVQVDDADRVALPQFTTLVAPADYPAFLSSALPGGSGLEDIASVHSMRNLNQTVYQVVMNDGSQRLVMFDVAVGSTLNIPLQIQPLNGVFGPGESITLHPSYVVSENGVPTHTTLDPVNIPVNAALDWQLNKSSAIQQNGVSAANLGNVSDYAANDTTIRYTITSDNVRYQQNGTYYADTVTIEDTVEIQSLSFPAASTDVVTAANFTCLTEGDASNFYYNGALLYSLNRPDVEITPVITNGKLTAISYTYTRTNTAVPAADLSDETLVATFHLGNGSFGYTGSGEPAITNSATQSVDTKFDDVPVDVDAKTVTDIGTDQADIAKVAYRDEACTIPLAPGEELGIDASIYYKVRVDNHSNEERTFGVYDNAGGNMTVPTQEAVPKNNQPAINPRNMGTVYDRNNSPVAGGVAGSMRFGILYIWTDITIPAGGHFECVLRTDVNDNPRSTDLDNNIYLFDDSVSLQPGMPSSVLNSTNIGQDDTHQTLLSDGAPVAGVGLEKRITAYDADTGSITYQLIFTNTNSAPVISGAVDTWPSDYIDLTGVGGAGGQRYRVLTTGGVTYDSIDYPHDGYDSPLAEMYANGQTLDKVTLLNTVVPANGSVTVELTGTASTDAPATITNSAAFGTGGDGGESNPPAEASVVLINHKKFAYHATLVGDEFEMGSPWTDSDTGAVQPDSDDYVAWEIQVQNVSGQMGTYRVEDYLPVGLAPVDSTQVVLIRGQDHTGAEVPLGYTDAIEDETTGVTTLRTNTFELSVGEMAFVRIYTLLTQEAIDASFDQNYVATNTACVQAKKDDTDTYASATEDEASILTYDNIPRYLTISKDLNRSTLWEYSGGKFRRKTMYQWSNAGYGFSVGQFAYPGSFTIFAITLSCTQSDIAGDVPVYRVRDTLPETYEYVALQAFPTALTNNNKNFMVGADADLNANILVGEGSRTVTVGGVLYTYTATYDASSRVLDITFRDALGNPLMLNNGENLQFIMAARCIGYSDVEAETTNVTTVTTDSDVEVNEVKRDLYGTIDPKVPSQPAAETEPAVGSEPEDGQSDFRCSTVVPIGDIDVGIVKKATRYINDNGDYVAINASNPAPSLGNVIEWEIYVIARTPTVSNNKTYQFQRFPIENFSVSDVIPAGFKYYENDDPSITDHVLFGVAYDLNTGSIDSAYNSALITASSNTGVVALEDTNPNVPLGTQNLTWSFSGYAQAQHFDGSAATILPATVIRYYTTWEGDIGDWRYGTYTNDAKVTFADNSYLQMKDNPLPGTVNAAENSVSTSATLSIFGAYGTTSRKGVSTGAGATLSETDGLQATNYVTTVDAEGNARFLLEVTNKSGGGPFSKFAVVDFLPQQGDVGVLSSSVRGSEFDMQISPTPNFTVKILDENNVETEVPAGSYTVKYGVRTAGTESVVNDYSQEGPGSITWSDNYTAGDNAFSLRINDDFLQANEITLESRVQIYFDAKIKGKTVTVGTGEEAQQLPVWPVAGDIAYNSFGYYYAIAIEGGAEATGRAEPSQVGVRIHDAVIDIAKAPLGNISAEDAETLPPFSFIVEDTAHRDPVTYDPLPVVGAACYLLDENGEETGKAVYTDNEGRLSVAAGTAWRVHVGYGEYRVVEDVEDPFSLVSVKTDDANPGYTLTDATAAELEDHCAPLDLYNGHDAVKTEFANTTVADFQVGKTVSGTLGDTDRSYTVMLRAEAVAGANEDGDTIAGQITGADGTSSAVTVTLGQWSTFTLKNGETITLNDLPLTTPLYVAEIVPDDLLDSEYNGNLQVGLVAGGVGVTLSSDAEAWDAAVAPLLAAHRSDADYADWETFAIGRGAIYSICYDPVEAEGDPQLENYLHINNLTDTPAPTGVRTELWPYVLLLAIAGAGLVLTRRKKRRD